MKKINFFVLPVLNPDGYEFSWSKDRMWRKNRRPGPGNRKDCPGVDLNRNFDMEWGFGGEEGSSGDPCEESYRGTAADSEPETKVFIDYVKRNLPKIKGFVTFHSYSQLIMYSYSYTNKLPRNYKKIHELGERAARNVRRVTGANYTVQASAVMYPAAGVSDDWAFQQRIPYVYCVELRDTGDNGFILPPSEIVPTGQDGLEIIKTIAEEVVKLPR
nr:PREDICTED: carboxypeptidase B-like [Bemisia tabaci]